MVIKVLKSEFLYSVPKLSMMQSLGPEICFIGRSNVGKSSLINAVCQKRDLARTSKMPGRTRHAVCYDVLFASLQEKKSCILVDLPGFGYATMSKADAKTSEALIFSYLEKRRALVLLVLLIDIRRMPDEREEHIVKIAKSRDLPVLLVLTKCDKIVLSKRKMVMKAIAKQAAVQMDELVLHSTEDQQFTDELREKIFLALE